MIVFVKSRKFVFLSGNWEEKREKICFLRQIKIL